MQLISVVNPALTQVCCSSGASTCKTILRRKHTYYHVCYTCDYFYTQTMLLTTVLNTIVPPPPPARGGRGHTRGEETSICGRRAEADRNGCLLPKNRQGTYYQWHDKE